MSQVRNGATLFRELFTVPFADLETEVEFPYATELWCVQQTSVPREGTAAKPTSETRYFVSSLAPGDLNPTRKLALVRLHWGIENGHHWTLDTALQEDDVQPCQVSAGAIEVVAWLRVLAYNLLSEWRQARSTGRVKIAWVRAMVLLRDALLNLAAERTLATLG